MKRIITIMVAFIVLLFTSNINTMAAERRDWSNNNPKEFYNEYDYIVAVRSTPRTEMEEKGASSEELDLIYSDHAEKEMLRRASLSDEELSEVYQYSSAQISILRGYKGTPIEKTPQLRSVMASISGSFSPVIYNSTMAGMMLSWQWSTLPITMVTDAVAIAWEATYANGGNNNMLLNLTESYAQITYKPSSNGTPHFVNINADSTNMYHGAFVTFPFVSPSGYGYAYKGFLYAEVSLANPSGPQMVDLVANAQYAHYTYTPSSLSVSFLGDLAISFSGTSQIVLNKNLHISMQ